VIGSGAALFLVSRPEPASTGLVASLAGWLAGAMAPRTERRHQPRPASKGKEAVLADLVRRRARCGYGEAF
jgi:hypothetical protein